MGTISEKRAVEVSWDEVCDIISVEIEEILGVHVLCKVNITENIFWDATFIDYRLKLSKLCQLLQAVQATPEDWESSLPDDGGRDFDGIGAVLAEKLVGRCLCLTWEHHLITKDCVHEGIKMNFLVDMERRKYVSVCKEEDIGLSLCSLYPVDASKPIIMLTEESQQLGLYAYVGIPSNEGLAYIFSKDNMGSLFLKLQEFHFLSLHKDPVHNFDHGLLLSYNPEWGWKNISFSIILKENQDMVRQLFDSVRSPAKPIEQPSSNKMNMGTTNYFSPWK